METLQRTANRGSVSTGNYEIDNSLKFEDDNSEGLVNNYSGDGTPTKWTFSGWVKRSQISQNQHIFSANYSNIRFITEDWLRVELYTGSATYYYDTSALFRDTSAWYHIVFQFDSTQGTAANRTKLWVNGVLNDSFGQYDTHTNIPQNATVGFGEAASNFQIGFYFVGGANFRGYCGYFAEFHFTDGVANDADAFGETDSDTGIWIPKEYTGSHGSKGIYLKFDDSSNLGKNSASGGVGDFSNSNITAADQATDTPTNNFCIFNPVTISPSNLLTLSEGATQINRITTAKWNTPCSNSMNVNKGKWYGEFQIGATYTMVGVGIVSVFENTAHGSTTGMGQDESGINSGVGYYAADGKKFVGGASSSYGATYTSSDIIGIAMDLDNNKVYFAKNNTWQNSGVPTSGATGTGAIDLNPAGEYFFMTINANSTGYSHKANFGGYTTISISSAASDANGYGTFEYAPPSGFYAICTKNLAEFG